MVVVAAVAVVDDAGISGNAGVDIDVDMVVAGVFVDFVVFVLVPESVLDTDMEHSLILGTVAFAVAVLVAVAVAAVVVVVSVVAIEGKGNPL